MFRLLSKGTIEEMCYMRQIYKLQITSAAMGDQARGGRRQFNAVQVCASDVALREGLPYKGSALFFLRLLSSLDGLYTPIVLNISTFDKSNCV